MNSNYLVHPNKFGSKMNRVYILFLFVLFLKPALDAQDTYYPFIEEGKTFAIADRDGSICGYSAVYRYRFGEEVEIDDVNYRNVELLNYNPNGSVFCPPFTAESEWNTTDFYVRENVEERKVYFKLDQDEEEFVLYDFSLEVGDSISTPFNINDEYYHLLEINNINLVDGTLVQEYVFSGGTGSFDGNFKYIESLGSVLSTFGDFGIGIGFHSELLCVEINDNLIYDGNCSGFVLETEEIEKQNNLTIYPNPATDFVTVEYENYLYSKAQVVDATGRLVQSIQLNGSPQRINLDGLNSGIYFLAINNEFGISSIEKIVLH